MPPVNRELVEAFAAKAAAVSAVVQEVPTMAAALQYVVDVCASKDAICRKNSRKHGFLVDVHRAGFGAIGQRTGLFDGEFEVVGSLSAADIPDRLWHPDVVRGKDYMQCRRSGGSLGWVPLRNRRGMCAKSVYVTF